MWAAVFRNPDRPSTSNLANPLAPIGLFTADLLFCFVVFILYVVKSSILHDLCHGEKLIGIQNSGLVLFLVFSMWFAGLLSLESSGCLSSKARDDVCNHPSNPPLDEFLPRPVVQSLLLSYWCRKYTGFLLAGDNSESLPNDRSPKRWTLAAPTQWCAAGWLRFVSAAKHTICLGRFCT